MDWEKPGSQKQKPPESEMYAAEELKQVEDMWDGQKSINKTGLSSIT